MSGWTMITDAEFDHLVKVLATESHHSLITHGVETFLVVQWLRLHASIAGDLGLISGQGTKIPVAWPKKTFFLSKKKKKSVE